MIGISDMIEVKEKDFNSFFKAPFNAYGSNSLYVSPFKSDLKRFLSNKNPKGVRIFLNTLFCFSTCITNFQINAAVNKLDG